MDKWDSRFIRLACDVASWSKDPNKKVGALAVSPDKKHIITAYNGPPATVDDETWKSLPKEEKNAIAVHAEINLIINAQQSLTCWSIYVTKPPCVSCAIALAQLSIAKLVRPNLESNSSWSISQTKGDNILRNTGTIIVPFDIDIYMEQT